VGGSTAAPSARDQVLITFWTDQTGGTPAVWTMAPDGSDKRVLTRGRDSAKDAVFSPDGTEIVFYGAENFGTPGRYDFDIQLMRSDGSARRFLTRTAARETQPRWSRDGTRVFFTRRRDDLHAPAIWELRLAGRAGRLVHAGYAPRPSPDGRSLLFSLPRRDQDELAVLDLQTGAIRTLTRTAADEVPGDWSPDGSRILFTRFAATSPEADVYAMDADGGGVRRLTAAKGQDVAAGWSPDGRQILFTSERTGRQQVFVANADGSRPRNLSRSAINEIATAWQRVPS
jgi:TolB protein